LKFLAESAATRRKILKNPVQVSPSFYPDRNLKCPYYGECLDYAVEQKWTGFSCARCKHRFDQKDSRHQ